MFSFYLVITFSPFVSMVFDQRFLCSSVFLFSSFGFLVNESERDQSDWSITINN